MAGQIQVGNISDLVALENSCTAFTEGLRDLVGRFASATGELGSRWRDEKFKDIENLADEIGTACVQAQNVVGEILIPFVERKRAALEGRPF